MKAHVMTILLLIGAAGPASAADPEPSAADRVFGISMIWQEANYNFAFFDLHPELDWNAEYRTAITRVLAAPTTDDYLREAQRFTALLGEAHTNLKPGETFRERHGAAPAVDLEEIEHRAIVVNTSRELADRIPRGSEIVAVDGVTVPEKLARDVFPFLSASTDDYRWRQSIRGHAWRAVGLLVGDAGTEAVLTVETPDGTRREVRTPRLSPGTDVDWIRPRRGAGPPCVVRRRDDGTVIVTLSSFSSPEVATLFEENLDTVRGARGVILDVRDNGGGNSRNGWMIGRWFSEAPLEVSHWKTRNQTAAFKAWGRNSKDPERKAHAAMDAWYVPEEFGSVDPPDSGAVLVPLAIVFGPSTYSAAEDFLSFMRAVPRAVYVGSPSAGSTGQPLTFEIPGGARVGITAKHDVMPDGTEFVGVGVIPDVEVRQTVAAERAGRDLVMERAVETIAARIAAGR